ncbi:MAG: beta-ketoacyl-ACP synthase III [bacterium]
MKPQSMIIGTGHQVPTRVLTNFDFEKIVSTTNEWIVERTGIHERRIKEDHQNTSDFCVAASQEALQEAGLEASAVDAILLATVTGDMRFPSTAIFVQSRLGAHQAAAFDISAACAGFLYGLILGNALITTQQYRHVLVIGAESLSLITDWKDRATCVLFGDGAGAAVLAPADNGRGILSTYMGSDGRLANLLCCPGGGTVHPISLESIQAGMHYLKMAGREVFLHAVKAMCDSADRALEGAGMSPSDIDLLIPHQANIRIIDALAKRMNMPKEKVYVNIDRFGNTSSASIPIALNEARRNGLLKPGMTCLMVAFGGGFTWASTIVKF